MPSTVPSKKCSSPSLFFIAYSCKVIKNAAGATQFRGLPEWKEFKDRLVKKYNIEPDSILAYSEFINMKFANELGDKPYWNVVVCPGEGDTSAADPKVLGTYLLFH